MIQVYADDRQVYDSRLEELDLDVLKATTGLNVGGTAELTMQDVHPAAGAFVWYRTLVTIYRDGKLRFRGRAIYPDNTIFGRRTIVCEGELCFLRDGMNRPYSYKSTPAKIFRALINRYNEQVEEFKRFVIGTVSIPDEEVELKNDNAEDILATLNKLLDRCGGYIVFTDNAEGARVINWLSEVGSRSSQVVDLSENLLDFSSTGANNGSLATGLVPYGAKDEKTKQRITIESVNGGKDYILAEDAKAIHGTIMATATWDDVTTPAALLEKARAHLAQSKSFITSLELTTLDLSVLDKTVDSFTVGDTVRVFSPAHGLNDYFLLSQMTENFLNPAQSSIVLGKEIPSLTGADVKGDYYSQRNIESTAAGLRQDYDMDMGQITTTVEGNVMAKVSGTYATGDEVDAMGDALSQTDEVLLARIVKEESTRGTEDTALRTLIEAEVNARAGVINKVGGTVHISGGAPINMLGGKIDINGSEINFLKEIRFPNGLGVRIADKDGNFYYVLRVDEANSCVVGNDYTNLYLRGKDAVYLYKTGAAVTSDQRQKNSVEAVPEAYLKALDGMTPVRFRYNGRGDKYHVGFVAQDVDAALTAAGLTREDFGGFVDVAGDGSELGLAYDEFVGLLLEKIRRLEKRIEKLEE